MDEHRVPVRGSELTGDSSDKRALSQAPASDTLLTVTVMVRRPSPATGPSAAELLGGTAKPQSREQAEASMSADPADLQAVRKFAEQYRLQVLSEAPAARQVKLRGTASEMEKAFGTTLEMGGDGGHPYRTYTGSLSVPSFLAGIVVAVLGLDQRPIAKH